MARLPSITSKDQVAAKDHATFDSIVASRSAVQGPFTMFLHSPPVADWLTTIHITQLDMDPRGFSTGQPARFKPFTSTSRRNWYCALIFFVSASHSPCKLSWPRRRSNE